MSNQILPRLLQHRGLKLVDLARLLKVDKATVTRWSQKEIPTDRIADVVRVTGISATDLRPDLASVFAADKPEEAPERQGAA